MTEANSIRNLRIDVEWPKKRPSPVETYHTRGRCCSIDVWMDLVGCGDCCSTIGQIFEFHCRELEGLMVCRSHRFQILLPMCLFASVSTFVGCQPSPATALKETETTAEVRLPESNPPVLSKAVADRIKPGMSQEEVLGILHEAGKNTPAVGSLLDNMVTQGKANPIRYALTVTQGKRKLVLAFRDAKLVEKDQEGLE